MRGSRRGGSLVSALPLLGLVQLGAPAASAASESSLLHRIVAGRLSVGVRGSLVRLEDTRRYGPGGLDNANLGTNFLGSLWGLDARLDLLFRHSQTEAVTARAYFYRNHHRDGAFPMRRDELGLGLRWAF